MISRGSASMTAAIWDGSISLIRRGPSGTATGAAGVTAIEGCGAAVMTAETVSGGRRTGAGRAAWLGAAAAACLAAAAWLRQPSVGYVLILAGATIFAAIIA